MVVSQNERLVSVIVPVHNGEATLKRTVNSVLYQTHEPLELILLDDGSTDRTHQVMSAIKDPRVRCHRSDERRGQAHMRNRGIDMATGRYIAFLDADDIWLPEKLELQIRRLEALDDSWGGVYCRAVINDVDGRLFRTRADKEGNLQYDMLNNRIELGGSSTLMFRRECLEHIGGFDEGLIRHTDWDLLLRFFDHYKLASVPEALVMKDGYNPPSAREYAANKERYLAKFGHLISSCGPVGSRRIRAFHWLDVSYRYLEENDIRNGLSHIKRALRETPRQTPRRYSEMVMRVLASILRMDARRFFTRFWGHQDH